MKHRNKLQNNVQTSDTIQHTELSSYLTKKEVLSAPAIKLRHIYVWYHFLT